MSHKVQMGLQCPMPQLDFDVITLGHGSGGILTNQLLDKGVFKLFNNELLQKTRWSCFLISMAKWPSAQTRM